MRKYFTYTMLTFMLVALWNCGGVAKGPNLTPEPSRKTFKAVPDWFNNKPQKEGYYYVATSATSQDFQTAIDKAELAARKKIGETLEAEVSGVTNRAIQETGLGAGSEYIDQFKNTQELILSTTIKGAQNIKQELQEEKSDKGDIYRAYVLMEYDSGLQQKALLNAIKADQLLYEKLQATELLEEMEAKVEAYRQRKGQ